MARETFSLSRAMVYFTEAELIRQSGHTQPDWPILIFKETLDNGLDSCESAGVPPKIAISIDEHHLVVSDNGPGLPADVVARILDFNSRTSDKAAYVGPSRGTMGNGLKLVLCVPFVLNENRQTTMVIEACGIRHVITIDTDEVRRQPKIGHRQEEIVKTEGTTFRVPCDSPYRRLIGNPHFYKSSRTTLFSTRMRSSLSATTVINGCALLQHPQSAHQRRQLIGTGLKNSRT
jgi:hypothetical protein